MFLRFVISEIDDESQRELGIFQAIDRLRRRGVLSHYEEQQDDSIGKWFDKNLAKPPRFTASKPPFYRKKSKASISQLLLRTSRRLHVEVWIDVENRNYHYLSHFEIASDKRIYQHLSKLRRLGLLLGILLSVFSEFSLSCAAFYKPQ